jgi:carboxypeptidase Q
MAPGPQSERALAKAREIGRLLKSIGADSMTPGGGGGDISPVMEAGVPGFGMNTVGVHYFDWHHTPSDTIDKIKPEEFKQNIAALAVLSYVLADMPDRLVE